MRKLIALSLGLALLAGCASTDDPSEPEAAEPEAAAEDDVPEDDLPDDDVIGDDTTDDAAAETPAEDDEATEVPSDGEADETGDTDETGGTEVAIGDFFFDAETTSVAAGETVTWTHEGDITHNVTARDDSFASDNLTGGDTFTHTFDTAGSFEYRCTLHGQMVGTIDVS